MTNKSLVLIEDDNLSVAWARAFLETQKIGVEEVSPMMISITGLIGNQPKQDKRIRSFLDQALKSCGEPDCNTVANTIFPETLWNPGVDRQQLFNRYAQVWPRVKKCRQNRYGTYFHRLIDFTDDGGSVNQLDHIIRTYRGKNHRRTALQASVFDPQRDHTNQRRRGFPCLQHILFNPNITTGELDVTGIYAYQHIFQKAYGNYLGLCRIGHFMAHEMGFQLGQVNCLANIAVHGGTAKAEFVNLSENLQKILNAPKSV